MHFVTSALLVYAGRLILPSKYRQCVRLTCEHRNIYIYMYKKHRLRLRWLKRASDSGENRLLFWSPTLCCGRSFVDSIFFGSILFISFPFSSLFTLILQTIPFYIYLFSSLFRSISCLLLCFFLPFPFFF